MSKFKIHNLKFKMTVAQTISKPKVSAPKAKPDHPPAIEMVKSAISAHKSRKGLSLNGIKKYIIENHNIDLEKYGVFLRRSIKNAVEKGTIIRLGNGKGASGSFKFPPVVKATKAPKEPIDATATKETEKVKKVAEKKVSEKKTVEKKETAKVSKNVEKKAVSTKVATKKVVNKAETKSSPSKKPVVKATKKTVEKKSEVKKSEDAEKSTKVEVSKKIVKKAASKEKVLKAVPTVLKSTPKKVVSKSTVKKVAGKK